MRNAPPIQNDDNEKRQKRQHARDRARGPSRRSRWNEMPANWNAGIYQQQWQKNSRGRDTNRSAKKEERNIVDTSFPDKAQPFSPIKRRSVRASRTGILLPPSIYLFHLEAGAGSLIPLENPFEKPPHQQVSPHRHLYAGESKQAAHRHRLPKHRAARDRPLQRSSS